MSLWMKGSQHTLADPIHCISFEAGGAVGVEVSWRCTR
jgi:hypothetical protein